jgi:hypothetical protein
MTGRHPTGGIASSPLEIVAFAVALVGLVGVGVLWGAGVVLGSILGATLPGSVGEGMAALVRSFPDIGSAWSPPIPSPLVWSLALGFVVGLGPLAWRLIRMGRLEEEGAWWATPADLRRAGLLLSDRSLHHALPEEPADVD